MQQNKTKLVAIETVIHNSALNEERHVLSKYPTPSLESINEYAPPVP
jgi:hypothetical protein